jgi:putative hydrolase of HD superfamily
MPSSPLLAALLELQPLERLPRTGWIQAGMPSIETIAAHSHATALLVLGLGTRVEPPLDLDRACALAVLHDAPEALLGDLPRTAAALFPAGSKRSAERRAADQLLDPLGAEVRRRFDEVLDGRTREARFVKLCDRLQLGVRLLAYLRAGARADVQFRDWLAAQDCAEFPACAALQGELLAAIDHANDPR